MIDFKQKLEEEERLAKNGSFDQNEEELLLNNKKRKQIVTYAIAIVAIALVFCGRIIISSTNGGWLSGIGVFDKLKHLTPSSDNKLQGEDQDRINILLLGMGGEGHDGAYLTDTIILASFQPSTKKVSMVSIPRDLVSPVSNWRKINSINALAEQKSPGSGGEATAKAIGDLLQIPINYYVRVDFRGFSDIINQLGGIEVNVENTLDDYSYPILGQEDNPNYYARFKHLHFDKGSQTMDGPTALAYARSRHALGSEGSDFARARRQQLVLEAVKDKLFSTRTLLNPVMVTKLIAEFNKNISTNLSAWEIARIWDLFKDTDRSQIINKVLSDAPDGLLISGTGEDGAYILTPRTGNFSEIRNLIKNIFSTQETPAAPKPQTIKDGAKVLILNGTWVAGLAGKSAASLKQSLFTVLKAGNAPLRDFTQTTVYDLTNGGKPESLKVLKNLTQASSSYSIPDWAGVYQTASSTDGIPDFILVLGTDAENE